MSTGCRNATRDKKGNPTAATTAGDQIDKMKFLLLPNSCCSLACCALTRRSRFLSFLRAVHNARRLPDETLMPRTRQHNARARRVLVGFVRQLCKCSSAKFCIIMSIGRVVPRRYCGCTAALLCRLLRGMHRLPSAVAVCLSLAA